MSAEVLRKAASLMRERAAAATEGPWEADNCEPINATNRRVLGDYALVHDGSTEVALVRGGWTDPEHTLPDAEHIASWHPAVALAVADWLEAEASNADAGIGGRGFFSVGGQSDALTVARAYLGESA